MSRFTRFQKIVIGLIVFFTLFGFISKSMQDGNLVSKLGYESFTMLKYSLIDHPIETLKNWTSDFSSLWNVKHENDLLKKQLSSEKMYEVSNQELKRQNKELLALNKMNESLPQYTKINAKVMKRDDSMWNAHIVINRGSKDNIKENMAVISESGLIGSVESVNFNTSVVKLLTNEDRKEKLSVKIAISDSESSEGILDYYDSNQGCFVVKLFVNNDKVKKNMNVITSGLGGKYPSGLYVGKIKKISDLDNEIGKKLLVTPGADFANFHYVSVINQVEE
ncbi:MAG: rod shape-determining protein MreC [Erysipelotrichaceae bacterium]